jgi:hypothetical protein
MATKMVSPNWTRQQIRYYSNYIRFNSGGDKATLSWTATNTWAHFAATHDGSNVAIYLNGTSKDTGTSTYTSISSALAIGANCRDNPTTEYDEWIGDLAWGAVWDVVLSDGEIASLAGAIPLIIRPQSLKHFWPLGGAHEESFKDIVGGYTAIGYDSDPSFTQNQPDGLWLPSNPIIGAAAGGGTTPSTIEIPTLALTI